MVLEVLPINSSNDPTVLLEPLLSAMRKERYNYIKALYIWDLPLTNKEMTALVRSTTCSYSLLEGIAHVITCMNEQWIIGENRGVYRNTTSLTVFASTSELDLLDTLIILKPFFKCLNFFTLRNQVSDLPAVLGD